MFHFIFLIPVLLGWSFFLLAGNQYDSARYLGQGDTGVSMVEGFDSVFYNPGGLAKNKSLLSELVIASPQGIASPSVIKNYKVFSGNVLTSDKIVDFVRQNKNVSYFGDAQNLSGLFFKGIGISALGKASVLAYFGDSPETGLPIVLLNSTAYAGGILSFYQAFFSDALLIGFNAKYLSKAEGNIHLTAADMLSEFSSSSINKQFKNSIQRGYGLGADAGLIWNIGKTKPFSIGIAVKNIGMKYHVRYKDYPLPSADPTTVDAGFHGGFASNRTQMNFSFNIKDATNATQQNIFKRIHFGAQIDYNNFMGVMAGINDGYPSYGAFINIKFIRIEGGQYSAELGKLPGDFRSLRYFLRASVGFLK